MVWLEWVDGSKSVWLRVQDPFEVYRKEALDDLGSFPSRRL